MKKQILLFLALCCIQPKAVYADCVNIAHGKDLIEQADLIFVGEAIKSSPLWISYITFQRYNYYTT